MQSALAGEVRLWPTAVVTGDQISLTDVCELRYFDAETERNLSSMVLLASPQAGGSTLVHIELLRSALSAAGVNMAEVTLGGAVECAVSRPSVSQPQVEKRQPNKESPAGATGDQGNLASSASETATDANAATLRDAIIDHLNQALARYAGRADVRFDHTAEPLLDLTAPPYEFVVQPMGRGEPLGLTRVEVSILSEGRTVQTLEFVLNVSLIRSVIVAGRPINQDAVIRSADLQRVDMSFSRVDRIGMDDQAMIIGQRAKRFMPAGSMIEADQLEAVPLVEKGQLVSLASVCGGVQVVTSAKAMQSGFIGEVIAVRDPNRKDIELEAVIVAPGKVRIGDGPPRERHTWIAARSND